MPLSTSLLPLSPTLTLPAHLWLFASRSPWTPTLRFPDCWSPSYCNKSDTHTWHRSACCRICFRGKIWMTSHWWMMDWVLTSKWIRWGMSSPSADSGEGLDGTAQKSKRNGHLQWGAWSAGKLPEIPMWNVKGPCVSIFRLARGFAQIVDLIRPALWYSL